MKLNAHIFPSFRHLNGEEAKNSYYQGSRQRNVANQEVLEKVLICVGLFILVRYGTSSRIDMIQSVVTTTNSTE